MPSFNPFAKRDSHGALGLNIYRILVPLSWALVVVFGIFYSIRSPADINDGRRIWDQADAHQTLFSQNVIITGIYWILLLLSQLSYLLAFFSKDDTISNSAANVASHYILNNLFVFAWILLWVRNYFPGAEVILAAHFINQTIAYWRHPNTPAAVHLPAIAGPYAWTLMALFWNGAVAVNSHTFAARVVANVFIWVVMVVGATHVFVGQDYMLGSSLSLLGLSLAVKQFATKIDNLQWIFAWVVFAVFVVESFYGLSTRFAGRDALLRRISEPDGATDRERQPLLDEQTQ